MAIAAHDDILHGSLFVPQSCFVFRFGLVFNILHIPLKGPISSHNGPFNPLNLHFLGTSTILDQSF